MYEVYNLTILVLI